MGPAGEVNLYGVVIFSVLLVYGFSVSSGLPLEILSRFWEVMLE